MKITPEFIDDLKFRNRIEEVISMYVTLKRAGSRLVGLCPFHSEKTPSFTVFTDTNSYHCFGCGAGGDVITFVMAAENLDYLGALEFLCNRVGMKMPDTDGEKSESGRRRRFYDMNREAARFFHASLSKPGAENAVDYLMNKRKLPKSAITRFGIGYAPDSFDALRSHMISLGYKDEELKEAFLCGKSKTGKYFDYFRGRIMFPIIDNFGNVIAFGGRAIGDKEPKYLNSSDTPVFKKSRNLYSLNFARTCCSEELILCEGYMDVIGVNLAGLSNAVATLGTALTSDQARIMAKYTKKVVIAYDSDGAGTAATKRAIPMLTDAGLEVRVLHMDGAKDPDEYVKKFGAEKFRALVAESEGKLEFLLGSVLKKYNVDIPDEKIKAAEELCIIAADIESNIEREVYVGKIASALGLDVANVRTDTERKRKYRKRDREADEKRKIVMSSLGVGDRVNRDYAKNVKAAHAEETVLGLMLLFPEYTEQVRSGKTELTEEDFVTEFNRRVFQRLIERGSEGGFGAFADEFSPEEISRMSSMLVARQELTDNSERVFEESVKSLKNAVADSREKTDGDIDSLMKLIERKKRQNK
ncbi:MAG: DNA primase [Clostridiales bacterium]|nr:DNA primase [Clostridiales bacterium]